LRRLDILKKNIDLNFCGLSKSKRKFFKGLIYIILSIMLLGMTVGCQPTKVADQDVYHFKCDYKKAGAARDIEITQTATKGVYNVKGLSKDSYVPVSASLNSALSGNFDNATYYYDAPGSRNVSVKIDSQVGFTDIAGLRFKKEVVINIWDDGTVEADREGIEAVGNKDSLIWVAKKVTYQGKTAIVMVVK
jgi:hypothetical protein